MLVILSIFLLENLIQKIMNCIDDGFKVVQLAHHEVLFNFNSTTI
jgi:hypothetical protein